jgi:hypothetical protein
MGESEQVSHVTNREPVLAHQLQSRRSQRLSRLPLRIKSGLPRSPRRGDLSPDPGGKPDVERELSLLGVVDP